MLRLCINGNFIDKIFIIVVDILLWVILIIFGEKEVFIYYRDGVIWLLLFFFFVDFDWNRKKNEYWKKIYVFEGEVYNIKKIIFFVMYLWLM